MFAAVHSVYRGSRRGERRRIAALLLRYIEYVRGHTRVLDREHLEERVCERYAVVKKEYDRLLPPAIASGATAS